MGGGKVQHGRCRGGLFLSCFSAEKTGEAGGGEDGRLLDAGKGSLSVAWESYSKTLSARAAMAKHRRLGGWSTRSHPSHSGGCRPKVRARCDGLQ